MFPDHPSSKLICHTHRGTELFATHAWILKSLLRQSKFHLEILQLYVVAADFKKMLSRMNHAVSTHYLACFQRVKSRTFEPIGEVATKPFDINDTLFLDAIPILAELADTKIPNLKNKETWMEFHGLLCELLERFHHSLKDLKDIEKLKVKKRKEDAQIGQSDWKEIMDQLGKVLAIGQALRAIVRGSSITAHLATISPFLEVKTGKHWPLATESEPSEDDAEFHLLEPYSTDAHSEPLLPWKSFHDWLRLMVHHFDAIHVLDHHLMSLNSPSPINISIKILYPSLPDGKMLPWKRLLENEKYFPPIQHTPDQPSAAELIEFLSSPTLADDGKNIDELINYIGTIKKKQASATQTGTIYTEFTTDIQILTDEINFMKDYSSDGWKNYIIQILQQVEALGRDSTSPDHSGLENILNMLENLRGSFLLYKRVQPGTPLSLGTGFVGSVHCEGCAAVMNSLSPGPGAQTSLSETLEEFKVSHISVPCLNLGQIYNTDNRTYARSV